RTLRTRDVSRDEITIPIADTAMGGLLAALVGTLAVPTMPRASDAMCQGDDWSHNLRWARRRLTRAAQTKRSVEWSMELVYRVLVVAVDAVRIVTGQSWRAAELMDGSLIEARSSAATPANSRFIAAQTSSQSGDALDQKRVPDCAQ